MVFSRKCLPLIADDELTSAMRSCGIRVGAGRPLVRDADIEITLISATREALPHDYRLLGALAMWLDQHHSRVNVPRLRRIIQQTKPSTLEAAWWSTMATWLHPRDARWASIKNLYTGSMISLEGDLALSAMMRNRHGSDPRFDAGPLLIHAKLLRSRPQDVAAPEHLVQTHGTYRARVVHGTNHRTDTWAELDHNADRPIAEVARAVGCTYESARSVVADWRLARQASPASPAAPPQEQAKTTSASSRSTSGSGRRS